VKYRAARHKVIGWTRSIRFELALAQLIVGFGLLALAYLLRSSEPPIVLWMSALALVFSGLCTMAVAAIDEGQTNEGDTP
jgi:hypothetical protein